MKVFLGKRKLVALVVSENNIENSFGPFFLLLCGKKTIPIQLRVLVPVYSILPLPNVWTRRFLRPNPLLKGNENKWKVEVITSAQQLTHTIHSHRSCFLLTSLAKVQGDPSISLCLWQKHTVQKTSLQINSLPKQILAKTSQTLYEFL